MTLLPRIIVWPPLSFAPYVRRPQRKLPFPLEEPGCRIFSRARQGLFMGLKALGLAPGDEILAPAYHHGSEIEALVQAGLVCRFYDIGQGLEPDEEQLEAPSGSRVRALYLTHYLGLPQDAARWRSWCDERGMLLIEDAAQAWLSSRDGTPVGSYGNLSIFCLYKTFGLPDGAAVLSTSPPKPPGSKPQIGAGHVALRHGSYLAQRWGWLAEFRRRLGDTKRYESEEDFALGDPSRAPYAATDFLLAREKFAEARAARAANYAFLLERLGRFVPEPFAHLPEGASPFAFPVQSNRKEALLDRLAKSGIVALNFWSVPHRSLSATSFPRAAELRNSVVALPVHQELGAAELERIVATALDGLGLPTENSAEVAERSGKIGL